MKGHPNKRKPCRMYQLAVLLVIGMNIALPSGLARALGRAVPPPFFVGIQGAMYIDLNANKTKESGEECSNFPAANMNHFRCAHVAVRLYTRDPDGPLRDTGKNTTTNDAGQFVFMNLNPGTYSVCEVGFAASTHLCSAPQTPTRDSVLYLGFVFGNLPSDPIPATSAFPVGCNNSDLKDDTDLSRSDPILTPLIKDSGHRFPNDPPVILEGTINTPPLNEKSNAEAPSEVSEEELPWYHYTHDKTQFVIPDSQYRGLLSADRSGNTVSSTVEVEWENASTMHLEGSNRIWGGLPEFAWPSVGNRVWVEGRWVFDCGHTGIPTDVNKADPLDVRYQTEIHPPRALVTFRLTSLPGRIAFADTNLNNVWDPGESVFYDLNRDGIYEPTDSRFRFIDRNGNGHWDPGEQLIFDNTHPLDPKIKFVDANGNGTWDVDELIVYDSNNNCIYDAGEPGILRALPAPGTFLGEPELGGAPRPFGTILKDDAKIRFFDLNLNNVWDPGESIVYDVNGDGRFDGGEPVIAGASPAYGSFVMNVIQPSASTNWLPATGRRTLIPVTEADVFVSGNGGGANDICSLRLAAMIDYPNGYNTCSHTGPVIPVNDRNYVFDIYPPGTDYGSKEDNKPFQVRNIPRDFFGTIPPLQWRIVDQSGQIPAHSCPQVPNGCRTIVPILCPIDATVGLPTQNETSCPTRTARSLPPTRLRVILPFAGTHANVFAKSILLGWATAPRSSSHTFLIRLNKLHIIQNGEGSPVSGDWRVFVDVGGQWRYISELSFQHFEGCDRGDSLTDNGDDDCFGFDNHPWRVSIQGNVPIHVAIGGFEADKGTFGGHTIDADYCRNLSGCNSSFGDQFDLAAQNDQRIGTIEFDLRQPGYGSGNPIVISTQDIKGGDDEIDYDVTFTVCDLSDKTCPL